MEIEFRNALAVGTELDTYRIERVLGEGGFGVTYLVTEINLGKEYAIKELIPDGVAIRQGGTTVMARNSSMEEDFEATRRHFIKEARVLATLKHPAIVAVHRLFEANGTCYMVMDYVEGETLGSYLKKQGGMLSSREEFEGIFYPIMDGLEVLHGKEMIHRDIKPGNIMVSPDGSPVLLDFGASCRVENHTVTMTQMVSAGYSPFEQYTARAKQGPYTDIYALGATMVRAITGAKPDDATDRMDEDHYQPLGERKDLPGLYGSDFLVAVDRALLLRKGDRPQSMGEWRKMMKTGGGSAALEVVPDSNIGIPEDKRPKLSPNRQPDVLDKAVVGDEKSEVVVRETGKKRLTLGEGMGLLVALGVIMYVINDGGKVKALEDRRLVEERKAAELKAEREVVIEEALKVLGPEKTPDPSDLQKVDQENLRLAAESGDPRAQYLLGKMYANGHEVTKDESEAAKWFRKSAEQGFAQAQFDLGIMYYNGLGVPYDEAEALKWSRMAADQGHAEAQGFLGAMCYMGIGADQDFAEAVSWYRKAADQGNADGQYNLGIMYGNGRGVAKDEKEALRWYRLAADQGDVRAQYDLGIMYDKGEGGVEKDDAEAVKWYSQAALQGEASAQYNLGIMFANGRGVTRDEKEAAKWYRKAADQDFAEAQYNLGVMYGNGRGVTKDEKEAVKWYRLAADQGHAMARSNLGVMYGNGRGVTKDEKEAVKWYRLAAEQGEASAQYNLGVCYANGRGVTKDDEEAVKWYRLAADQGDAKAQCQLGVMYDMGRGVPEHFVEAVKWYRLAADQGDVSAQSSLGFMYDEGRGVQEDDAEAMKWYRLAADQGDASAQYDLGLIYYYGKGVDQDYAEAVKWYRMAADQGDASAQTSLGVMYDEGKGVKEDGVQAVKWYRKAAEQGNAPAQYNLGQRYAEGRGVTKDDAEAVRWYRLAAEQGNAAGQSNLGLMYYNGEGVAKDKEKARLWLTKAAANGDESAKQNLLKLDTPPVTSPTTTSDQTPSVERPKMTIAPTPPNPFQYEKTQYYWKKWITATVFWIGEKPTSSGIVPHDAKLSSHWWLTRNNPTPKKKSSWDQNWQQNYGGYDNPDPASRRGYVPKDFTPKLNPFYVALPYNDCINHKAHKPEAARVIPWFKRYRPRPGQTVCKGRWVQIVSNKRVCYAQWEDCGPFTTNDWEYVFGNKKPKNTKNQNAGIDISPAVRDFLQVGNKVQCHWRFIEFSQVPRGPWSKYGTNNPFVNYKANPDLAAKERYLEYMRKKELGDQDE